MVTLKQWAKGEPVYRIMRPTALCPQAQRLTRLVVPEGKWMHADAQSWGACLFEPSVRVPSPESSVLLDGLRGLRTQDTGLSTMPSPKYTANSGLRTQDSTALHARPTDGRRT